MRERERERERETEKKKTLNMTTKLNKRLTDFAST